MEDSQECSQRGVILQTRCTIYGKVCNLITHGGSCTNLASQTLVDKLSLNPFSHPNPYEIQWSNQGEKIQINQQVPLSFSSGKQFKEELCCDVIFMDDCHIFLGRPWLFDRRVMYDGFENSYSFIYNARKFKLTSFPSHETFERMSRSYQK